MPSDREHGLSQGDESTSYEHVCLVAANSGGGTHVRPARGRFLSIRRFFPGFYPRWEGRLLAEGSAPSKKRGPQAGLVDSEIMTILVLYHSWHFKNFKTFYEGVDLALL